MQRMEEPEQKKKRCKRKRGAAAGLATLHVNEPGAGNDDNEEPPPPLFVYFNIKARQDQGEHVANLFCTETEESNEAFVFEGESCVEAFLDWVRSLAFKDLSLSWLTMFRQTKDLPQANHERCQEPEHERT